MTSHTYIKLITIVLLTLLIAPLSAAKQKPYNIIVILADDIGVEAFGSYGGTSFGTPNIDQLAIEGMRFDYAHAQPLCTPSRVKLMTGQYNFRNYERFAYLNASLPTFAQPLQKKGYATAIIGKWQLYKSSRDKNGKIQGMLPENAGFSEHLMWQVKELGSRYWQPRLQDNGTVKTFNKEEYGPTLFNDRALQFIEKNKTQPFLLYYPMVLPHDPFVTTPDEQEVYDNQSKYGAMVRYMDKMVGNIKNKVETLGLKENTLILFVGDNGSSRRIFSMQNGNKIKGAKGFTVNYGTHVPFIAWGGPTKAGSINRSLVDFNDVYPTVLELANIKNKKQFDGISLKPALLDNSTHQRDAIFIHYDPKWGEHLFKPARYAFNRTWKLYKNGRFFNLENDPLEKNDLSLTSLNQRELNAKLQLQKLIDSKRNSPNWLIPATYQ